MEINEKIWTNIEKLKGNLDLHGISLLMLTIAFVFESDSTLKRQLPFLGSSEFLKSFDNIIENKKYKTVIKGVRPTLEEVIDSLSDQEYKAIIEVTFEIYQQDGFVEAILARMSSDRQSAVSATPTMINDLLVRLADVKPGESVLDPSVGIGGTLLEVIKKNPEQTVVGQEINPETAGITQLVLEISGAKEATVLVGNTLTNPGYLIGNKLRTFDKVVTVPPFGVRMTNKEVARDPYNQFPFGPPARSSSDWAFISNAISSTDIGNGKAVVVAPAGALYRTGADSRIRRQILRYDFFEAIIALPERLLTNTSIPLAILIFNRNKEEAFREKVLFIKVSEEDMTRQRSSAKFGSDTIDKIVSAYENNEEIEGFSKIIDVDRINPDNMAVEQYLASSKFEIDGAMYDVDLDALDQHNSISLSSVAEIDRGFNMTSRNEAPDGEFHVLRISDVKGNKIAYDQALRANVVEGTKVENYVIQKGDIILSVRGTTNKVVLADEPPYKTMINSNLVRIRVKEFGEKKYFSEFIKLFMESPLGQAQFESFSMGTTIQQLPVKKLHDYRIPLISENHQKDIVERYQKQSNHIEKEIACLKEEAVKLKEDLYADMGISKLYKRIEDEI
ncbi:N-6 DNA methylase [Enterococcus faecium]